MQKITISLTMDKTIDGDFVQQHDNVFTFDVDDDVNLAMFYDKLEDTVLGFLQSTPVVQNLE